MNAQFMVINADDFGISSHASQEISRCIAAGRVSSTTLMANQKGFDEAVELARAGGFTDRIGVHINFTSGDPLSDLLPALRTSEGGLSIPVRRVNAPRGWVTAVEAEIRAQVAKIIAAGITPTHFDSHEHWHNSFPWTRAMMRVAREFGIRTIRPARNLFYARSPMKSGFKVLYNAFLRSRGFRRVRWFTDVKPWYLHTRDGQHPPGGPIELMCHPAARLRSPIRTWTSESDLLLSDEFGSCLRGITLVPYSRL